jgi:hypothetical protein
MVDRNHLHFLIRQIPEAQSEYVVTGKVIDQSTQLPLPAWYARTPPLSDSNSEGNFTLRLPNGGYDLQYPTRVMKPLQRTIR